MFFTAPLGAGMANRTAADQSLARRPIPPRVWAWAAVYFLFLAVVFVGLLLWGIAVDP